MVVVYIETTLLTINSSIPKVYMEGKYLIVWNIKKFCFSELFAFVGQLNLWELKVLAVCFLFFLPVNLMFVHYFFKVPLAEPRVTRRARKKLTGNTNSPHTDQTVPLKAKRGTRRKAQESSSYLISEYLDREVNFYQRRQILYTWGLPCIKFWNL